MDFSFSENTFLGSAFSRTKMGFFVLQRHAVVTYAVYIYIYIYIIDFGISRNTTRRKIITYRNKRRDKNRVTLYRRGRGPFTRYSLFTRVHGQQKKKTRAENAAVRSIIRAKNNGGTIDGTPQFVGGYVRTERSECQMVGKCVETKYAAAKKYGNFALFEKRNSFVFLIR